MWPFQDLKCAFGSKACFLLSGVFSALAASCYNHNLNLYTCNVLDFVTELCFVTVLMKIYIFEPFGLTLICKELALLACRLKDSLPPSHTQHVPA